MEASRPSSRTAPLRAGRAAQRAGLKVEDIVLCQPDSGEMALEVVDQLVRSGVISLIAVDSVAALVPRAEIEGEIGAVQGAPGGAAPCRAMSCVAPVCGQGAGGERVGAASVVGTHTQGCARPGRCSRVLSPEAESCTRCTGCAARARARLWTPVPAL
jgi:hypothetical protein